SDQHWTFFEIDPEVARIAGDPTLFTFLSDAFPNDSRMDIVIGDARLNLAKAEDSSFDLIVLDAFSSDSVPIHLLTQEALEIYLSKLTEGGLLVFHISNRHLDFRELLASLAKGRVDPLVCYGCDDLVGAQSRRERNEGKMGSQWVIMARKVSDLGSLAEPGGRWHKMIPRIGFEPWTDDYADILSIWKTTSSD
ncbi:MAG: fused MFS/spermidine synthase, partial [Candidatus Omnitrophica bacterium]|nr:fused MFS/spermidine synthase [Candidatus Omnitrophota bacterium]